MFSTLSMPLYSLHSKISSLRALCAFFLGLFCASVGSSAASSTWFNVWRLLFLLMDYVFSTPFKSLVLSLQAYTGLFYASVGCLLYFQRYFLYRFFHVVPRQTSLSLDGLPLLNALLMFSEIYLDHLSKFKA